MFRKYSFLTFCLKSFSILNIIELIYFLFHKFTKNTIFKEVKEMYKKFILNLKKKMIFSFAGIILFLFSVPSLAVEKPTE